MNFDYESEELLSLDESSSDSDHGDTLSDDDYPTVEVDNSIRRSRFLLFKLVAKVELIGLRRICCLSHLSNLNRL